MNNYYIDLYYVHQDDQINPAEEKLIILQKLTQQGKILDIGIKNSKSNRLVQSFEFFRQENIPRYNYLKVLYNLYGPSGYED